MKIYMISVRHCGYDEYDAVAVTAKTKKRAMELAAQWLLGLPENLHKCALVGLAKPGLIEGEVLKSFNAG